jgi:hypothetical protein
MEAWLHTFWLELGGYYRIYRILDLNLGFTHLMGFHGDPMGI